MRRTICSTLILVGMFCCGYATHEQFGPADITINCKCHEIQKPQKIPEPKISKSKAQKPVPVSEKHLTLFVGSDQKYAEWFNQHRGLKLLSTECNFNVISWSDPRFTRYNISVVPAILLQTSTGKVVYAAQGQDFPQSADQMHCILTEKIAECPLFDWMKPKPKPSPTPVNPDNVIQEDPATKPDSQINYLILGAIAAATGAAGYFTAPKEEEEV